MIALVRRTDRRCWARCGEVCGTRIFHQVYSYEENGERKLALMCPRCSSLTLLDVLFREAIHD